VCVLVVVDEHPLAALFLPPGGSDQVGPAAFQLARGCHGRGADLVGIPARLQPDVYVQPAVACRLRVAGQAELVEQQPQLAGSLADLGEIRASARIQVDSQLIGMVRVGGEVRPDVETQAAQVHRPQHVIQVGGDKRL
jgi:hypothetical protein